MKMVEEPARLLARQKISTLNGFAHAATVARDRVDCLIQTWEVVKNFDSLPRWLDVSEA
jgi:hypothetical protein